MGNSVEGLRYQPRVITLFSFLLLTIYRHALAPDLLVGEGGHLAGVAAAQVERGSPQEQRAVPLEAVPRVGDRVVQVQVAREQLPNHLVRNGPYEFMSRYSGV